MTHASDMTWEDFRASTDRVAILPVGSCEQHGPHLPLSTDTVIATSIAEAVARDVDGVMLPTLAYGYRSAPYSGGGSLFPGTVDLSFRALAATVADIVGELIADGFRRILVLNAHYENQGAIVDALGSLPPTEGLKVLASSWWDPVPGDVLHSLFDSGRFPGWDLEHAALTETSLMMHLAPHLVREDLIPGDSGFAAPAYLRFPLAEGDIPAHGALAPSAAATAEKGRLLFEASVSEIAAICAREFAG